MLVKHPTKDGWLIVRPEIEPLIDAPHRLVLVPGGPEIHPLDVYEPDITTLSQAKNYAVTKVNRQAEAERGKYITNLPGKIGEYRQKEAEFERWEAAGRPAQPDPALHPIAELESVECGLSLAQMLAVWGERAAAWAQVSAQIAAIERRALLAIGAAQSEAQVATILETLLLKTSDFSTRED